MTVKAKAWLLVQAKRRQYGPVDPDTGKRALDSVRIAGVYANKPTVQDDGEAVFIEIEFDDKHFDQAITKVQIAVPAPSNDVTVRTTATVKPRAKSSAAAVLDQR